MPTNETERKINLLLKMPHTSAALGDLLEPLSPAGNGETELCVNATEGLKVILTFFLKDVHLL